MLVGAPGIGGTWKQATEFPLSGHIQFRVDVPANAQSGTWSITRPDESVWSPSGYFGYVGPQRVFFSMLFFTGGQFDGDWIVRCSVRYGQGQTIDYGPTTFAVKNLSVVSMTVDGAGNYMYQDGVFAAAMAAISGASLALGLHDGFEVKPLGADPDPRVVTAECKLRPLAGGSEVSATATGQVDESTVLEAALGEIEPGLYYMDASVTENRYQWASGGPDGAQAYSSTLTIDSATRDGFEFTDYRSGKIGVHFHTGPGSVHPTASLGAVRYPDGGAGGVDIEVPTSSEQTVATSPVLFCLGGTYQFGVTLKDEGGNMHDGTARWAVPKTVTMEIPATAHFVGPHHRGQDPAPQPEVWHQTVQQAYAQLAWVVGPQYDSFYSGRPQIGVRGGAVYNTTLENLQHALDEDKIIHWKGHGAPTWLELGCEDYTACMVHQYPGHPRLIMLTCCDTLKGGDSSIGAKMHNVGGADVVIGYTDSSFTGASDEVDQRIWYYLAKECCSVADALEYAKKDYVRHWGAMKAAKKHINEKLTFVGNGGTTIVHAFG